MIKKSNKKLIFVKDDKKNYVYIQDDKKDVGMLYWNYKKKKWVYDIC